ncbi:MAG: carbohydrate kinase family protein [Acidobacteria bacterium]|nr:carbohydrate kinase family protein [Acidobacteriota bacterium]MCA1627394.1 carbohydrate kinase family protein [Acidobacteriota bacterium]
MKFPIELPDNKEFDAVGFGLNAVDHLMVVPEYPAFDTKVRFMEHKQSAGGQTATAMVSLKRLGLKTAYAGRFGSDSEGHFGLKSLIDEGVNCDFAQMIEDARNQIAFITIDARSGERTIVWDRDARLAYKPEEAPVQFGSLGRVLHLDAHDPLACVRVAKAAKESGTIVSADIDNVYEGLPELLPLIDILIGSKEFPHRVTGITDERAALVELHERFGCVVVGMTIGAAGAVVCCEGDFIESRGYRAPGGCRDTTGAGDAFHSGFLYGFLTGADVETSLKFGNAVAAMKCSALGARTALPTRPQLEEFLNRQDP